jgi:hypothetical protein
MTIEALEAALLLGSLEPGVYDFEVGVTFQLTSDGNRFWYQNGKQHREGGPAVERPDGRRESWIDGKCQRLFGPAVEWEEGDLGWWADGKDVEPSAQE